MRFFVILFSKIVFLILNAVLIILSGLLALYFLMFVLEQSSYGTPITTQDWITPFSLFLTFILAAIVELIVILLLIFPLLKINFPPTLLRFLMLFGVLIFILYAGMSSYFIWLAVHFLNIKVPVLNPQGAPW